MCGVDGCAMGVWLVPVLLESFVDSTLGGGELRGRVFRPFPPLCARAPGPFCEWRPWRFRPGAAVFGCVVFGAVVLCSRGFLRRAQGERSWLRCYGPRRAPGFPPSRERRLSCLGSPLSARERRVSHPHPNPLPEGEGAGHPHPSPLPSRERGFGSREAGGHMGPPLRPGNHPHPSPLPSRERGFGSREAGGHVGPPLRPGNHPHPSPLASRERGFGRAVRRGLCVR